jgi:hypothetical protein
MHRSGTSATTRVLNLLGVDVGPDEALVLANPNNPKGAYEHRELMLLNQAVLRVVGGLWKEPPTLTEGWENDPALDPIREQAREVIDKTFDGMALWGWKDPRTCLLLPFWQTVLPELHYVICIRNPVDVAESLEKRNELTLAHGFDLWVRYVVDSILYTTRQPRIFVFYEDYFVDWHEPVARLADFIGRPEAAQREAVRASIEDWLELDLRHHRNAVTDAIGHPELPPETKALYLLLHVAFRHERAIRDAGEDAAGSAAEMLNQYARSLVRWRDDAPSSFQAPR